MTEDSTDHDRSSRRSEDEAQARILGLSVTDLAGVSVQDLTGNETAIIMVMHRLLSLWGSVDYRAVATARS